ncbi:MAG: hypothetical protein QXK65_01410 [Candidatus Micrarchaeaceae archaeon]
MRREKLVEMVEMVELFVVAAVLAAIAYPVYALIPHLSISPSSIAQAPDARFYEGFVYNYSHLINSTCLVFTYDPTLFNINNRSAAQIGYLYSEQMIENFSKTYKCMVLDYGYWCYTPSGCPVLNSNYRPIINRTYAPFNRTYGFYYIINASKVENAN